MSDPYYDYAKAASARDLRTHRRNSKLRFAFLFGWMAALTALVLYTNLPRF